MFNRLVRLVPVLMLLPLVAIVRAAEPLTPPQLDARVGLNAYAALVEQQLGSARAGLRTLAATENAMTGNWDHIKGPLGELAEGVPIAAAVWFAKPDGSYYTVEAGLTGQNLKDRDYFPGLMAGREVVRDLVVSKSTGKRSTIIAVPVHKGGKIIGALGISVGMEKVAELVDDQMRFPNDVMFYALDGRGQIVLHRQSALLFEFAAQLGSPSLKAAVEEMLAKPEGVVRYEFQGAERVTIFMRTKPAGWVYALRW